MRDDVKKIGIIGAGVGGLITAKTLLQEGFDCKLFADSMVLGNRKENTGLTEWGTTSDRTAFDALSV